MSVHPRFRRGRRGLLSVLATVALAACSLAGAGGLTPAAAAVASTQEAVTPSPMGWASWNSFASQIDFSTIKAQADALVSSGMAAAGYNYINIDEGWWHGTRDSSGTITVDTAKWPGGMAAIASYIHSRGLKAGIYTDAGKNGCGFYFPTPSSVPPAPNTGSEGHYQQDMETFQNWGFDYVKVDWCGGDAEHLDQKTTYQAISAANTAATAVTGRKLVLSLCEWGTGRPWNWAAGTGSLWRTSADIVLFGNNPSMSNILGNFDKTLHPSSQHTGYYNDPDMLTVGMTGLTAAQNQTHMGLWAISGAPLLAGNNLATMSSTTASILTNREVIAIDQDPRGLQGVKVAEDATGLQVYSKVLSGSGKRAVLLLNRTSAAAPITARWTGMGLTTASASVRDIWSATDRGGFTTSYTATVPAGGSVLLTVSGTEASGTTYEAESAANTLGGSAATTACSACSGGSEVHNIGNGSANTLTFNGVTASASGVEIATLAYVNGGSTARTAVLQVNGQDPTVVSFPPTGSWSTPGTVSVLVGLAKGSANTLKFSNSTAWAPDLDAVQLQGIAGTNGNGITGSGSGRCADINDNTIVNGTQAQLWDCSGGHNQTFTPTSRGELVVYGNKCLDASNNGKSNGTVVDIWDCNSGTNQKWTVNSNGTITNNLSGLCLDASGNGTANGTKLDLWTCNGGSNQKWTLN
ncbi:RICIN domain-containing protein [Kitasatospora azatica]|uniref:RICIN domain-containing protein n=1 Tax=Kitasatospora azatica TaxID=58347 RepID=UPI000691BE58|nr:ricin-type beta-trefoil lectin domain protein [Kitasatospora azatica]